MKNLMSPFNEVFNTLNEKQEKALRQAFYNTIAVFFVLFVLVTIVAVYFVLHPFFKPLVWALLFGSALHPFKRKLNTFSRKWLNDKKKRPITLSVIAMPLSILNYSLNCVTKIVLQYYKLLMFIFFALLLTHLSLFYLTFTHKLFSFFAYSFRLVINVTYTILNKCNIYVLMFLIIVNIISQKIFESSYIQGTTIINLTLLLLTSILKVILCFGNYGIIFLLISTSIALIGVISSNFGMTHMNREEIDSVTHNFFSTLIILIDNIKNYFLSLINESSTIDVYKDSDESDEENKDESDEEQSKEIESKIISSEGDVPDQKQFTFKELPANSERKNSVQYVNQKTHLSNAYIYALLWSCILAQIWLRPSILYLIPVPIGILAIKWLWKKLNGYEIVSEFITKIKCFCSAEPFLFRPLFIFTEYFMIGDEFIAESLSKSVDAITSMITIIAMIVSVLFVLIFFAVQIYHESNHLVQIMSSVVNSTLVYNPHLQNNIFGEFLGPNIFDEMLGNAYVYGREVLQNFVRNTLNTADQMNANATRIVEKQLLEVWDRVYHQWLFRALNNSDQTVKSFETYNWNRLFAALKALDFYLCFNLLKENLDTVLSIFDSIWILLKGNVSLLFTLITATFSLLLSGSSAILNCFINLIVFLTSLFYLLCASGEQYIPVKLASKFFPSSNRTESDNYINKFGLAVEESINSVFAASFKMASFYALYTWLIHVIFEVEIVYIPSVLAMILAAVPFIGAYWASLPAALELWLIYGLRGKALLMILGAILPSYFVDSVIYSEIKGGGHPYLTGLAIAGGVFYIGFAGALFGPIILCCLIVGAKMYSSIMAPSETSSLPRKPQLKRYKTSLEL